MQPSNELHTDITISIQYVFPKCRGFLPTFFHPTGEYSDNGLPQAGYSITRQCSVAVFFFFFLYYSCVRFSACSPGLVYLRPKWESGNGSSRSGEEIWAKCRGIFRIHIVFSPQYPCEVHWMIACIVNLQA